MPPTSPQKQSCTHSIQPLGHEVKYGVYINQAGVADAGLEKATDFIDWAIISYIHDWQTAPRAARVADLVWINYRHLIDEMPLLGLNSKTSISSRMSKLKELGLIEVGYDKDKRLYARISDRCHEIILFRSDCTPNSGGVRQDVQSVRGDVQGGVRQDVHSTVNYISTDNQEHRPPDGANLEKVNSLQKKDCAKNAHTAKRKSRIPDDWEIEEDDPNHLYAKSKGMAWAELEVEEEKFRNHHVAKGSAMIDWSAAWRTWVTNWLTYRRGPYGKT